MDPNIVVLGGAALLGYFFFSVWRARAAVSKYAKKELEQVINGEEHKVKGRFE